MIYQPGDVVRLPDGHLVALSAAENVFNPWVGLTWTEDGGTPYVDDDQVSGDLVFRFDSGAKSGHCPRDHGCSLPAGHEGECSLTAALCNCAACEAKADARLEDPL